MKGYFSGSSTPETENWRSRWKYTEVKGGWDTPTFARFLDLSQQPWWCSYPIALIYHVLCAFDSVLGQASSEYKIDTLYSYLMQNINLYQSRSFGLLSIWCLLRSFWGFGVRSFCGRVTKWQKLWSQLFRNKVVNRIAVGEWEAEYYGFGWLGISHSLKCSQ